jgi:hypothetical protein
MANAEHDNGTLSSTMADDGISTLSAQSDQRKDDSVEKSAPAGGEDDGSAPIEGEDDHLHEDQKPITR